MDNPLLEGAGSNKTFNKDLVSACGLFCGACGIYMASKENDSEKLVHYAIVLNQTFEETICNGCGADIKSSHCSKMCVFISCKQKNSVEFCADCDEFPCQALIEFKSKMPHRADIIDSQKRMKEIGLKNWLTEMINCFSCPSCKIVNSAYHLVCRKCGYAPASKFVLQHKDAINKYLSEEI